jgi:type II restriction enzyme
MDLRLDQQSILGYSSSSQIARRLTESWVACNAYCPACGYKRLASFPNNNPVGDFYCENCLGEYELKSKKDGFSLKIVDGAYGSMIQRINAYNNPHFFFLNYSLKTLLVQNFLVIPKHFFVNDIIECRKPLSLAARRAGWTGCNILLSAIPESGKIFFVREGNIIARAAVTNAWKRTAFLEKQRLEARGWTIEVLRIVERIQSRRFSLSEVYAFEDELKGKFPTNRFVRDKIRQQLQVLRDRGIVEFLAKGQYRKL